MKKLIAALVLSLSLALGAAVPALGVTLTTPGTCVDGPDASVGGAVTAFVNVTAHTVPPVALDFSGTPCP